MLGNGLERRMRIEHAHDGEPATVGNAKKAHTAVVMRDIFDEPVDGVVCI